jgi:hypothetical protein
MRDNLGRSPPCSAAAGCYDLTAIYQRALMTGAKPEPAKESHQPKPAKAPYRSPRIELLGGLRSATRATGRFNGDGGQSMMAAPGRA